MLRRIAGRRHVSPNKLSTFSSPYANFMRRSSSALRKAPPLWTAIPSPDAASFRSLYRALLRQATYLPDPLARLFVKQRIVARFRAYSPRRNTNHENTSLRSRQELPRRGPTPTRRVFLWRAGIQSLHRLRRANQGYRNDLLNVLLSTYGRKGRRRHELLQPLKSLEQTHPANDTKDIVSKTLSEFPHVPHCVVERLPRLSLRLEALLKSQRKANLRYSTRPKTKSIVLNIPKTNIWLRPTPVKRVAGIVRRWYAEKLDQALPPLPRAEWNRLQGLALGQRKWEGPIIRRGCGVDTTSSCLDQRGHTSVLDQALGVKKVPRTAGKEQPHTLTSRYMQRLYFHVFQMCPDMDWDSTNESWIINWGSARPVNLLQCHKNSEN